MTSSDSATLVMLLGLGAVVGAGAALLLIVQLHTRPTDVDPIRDGVSAYALTPWAPTYRAQVRSTGAAAAAVAVAMPIAGIDAIPGLVTLLVFALARVAIAGYPTDPQGTVELSRTGRIHATLASVAFVAIALAAPVVGLQRAWADASPTLASVVAGLSIAVPVAVAATFGAGAVPALRSRFGLVERAVYATALPWLALTGLALAILGSG